MIGTRVVGRAGGCLVWIWMLCILISGFHPYIESWSHQWRRRVRKQAGGDDSGLADPEGAVSEEIRGKRKEHGSQLPADAGCPKVARGETPGVEAHRVKTKRVIGAQGGAMNGDENSSGREKGSDRGV